MKRMINQQNEEPMDDPCQVEIGEKVKRVRRRVVNSSISHEEESIKSLHASTSTSNSTSTSTSPPQVEISNSEQFLEYIIEKEPNSLPKSTTSQRYSTDHLLFNGAIPEGLYHIFGVAKDLLGSSYRPKECNLMIGKIKY
jgi:hypothetical protein